MYDLLSELSEADMNDKLTNYLKKLAKLDVLVIDDFLLTPQQNMNKNNLWRSLS